MRVTHPSEITSFNFFNSTSMGIHFTVKHRASQAME